MSLYRQKILSLRCQNKICIDIRYLTCLQINYLSQQVKKKHLFEQDPEDCNNMVNNDTTDGQSAVCKESKLAVKRKNNPTILA